MPAAAAAGVGGYIFGAGASFAVAGAAAIVTYATVTIGISIGLNRLSMALAGKPKRVRADASREVTLRGTVEFRQLIYGETRTPGYIAFYGTSGSTNRFLHFAVVIAGHQCEDVTDHWIDNRPIADADINGSTGEVTDSDFVVDGDSKLYIWRHLGTSTQAVDSELNTAFTEWTSDHRGSGITWAHYRLEADQTVWPNGAPGNFHQLVRGRRLYDPRLDSTNGGSGSHRTNDATTWAWSRNSALAVRDYLSGGSIYYNVATPVKKLAMNELDSRIDDAYTIAAANICDENVAIAPASPVTTQDRYTCDVQLSCGEEHGENMDILLSSMVGHVSIADGQYRIYAGAYDAPAFTLNEEDILDEDIEVLTHPNAEDTYNLVRGTFWDEDRGWTLASFPSRTNSTYESDDGEQKPRDIELHATRSSYRAQRIAMLHLAQSRNKILVRFPKVSPKAIDLAIWETFNVNITEYGWTNQVFRCVEWEMRPDGYFSITGLIEGSTPYSDPAVGDYHDPESLSPPAPQIETPEPADNLAATSRPNEIQFSWDLPDTVLDGTKAELWQHTSSSPFSSATLIWTGFGTQVRIPKFDTTERYYWVTLSHSGQRSTEEPSGAGVAGAATYVAYAPLGFLPDPDFSHAGLFWTTPEGTTGMTFASSGGLSTGVLTIVADGNVRRVMPLFPQAATGAPSSSVQKNVVNGNVVEVKVRWRRTSAGTTGATPNINFSVGTRRKNLAPSVTVDGTSTVDASIPAQNVWQEHRFTTTIASSDPNAASGARTFLYLSMQLDIGFSTGTVEVDYFDAQII